MSLDSSIKINELEKENHIKLSLKEVLFYEKFIKLKNYDYIFILWFTFYESLSLWLNQKQISANVLIKIYFQKEKFSYTIDRSFKQT